MDSNCFDHFAKINFLWTVQGTLIAALHTSYSSYLSFAEKSRERQDGAIFQQIAPAFRELVIPAELTPKLFSRGMLTPDENQMMSNEATPRVNKNIQLLQLLQSKGTEALDLLYLSILDSYESVLGKGLSGHYELARGLRQLGECLMPNYKASKN